jgi:hypothetical protein
MRNIIMAERYYQCAMKTISLKLTEALDNKLSAAARRQKRTKSSVVREVLEDYLEKSSSAKRISCLELASDLAGAFEGPSDLSTNKKHMEGFGR